MSLDTSGNLTLDTGNLTVSGTGTSSFAGSLGIATTSPNKSSFSTAVTVNGATNSGFEVAVGDTRIAGFYAASSIAVLNAFANVPLAFSTNNTTQMQLFANGNLFIGASPVDGGQKLQVSGNALINQSSGTSSYPLTIKNGMTRAGSGQYVGLQLSSSDAVSTDLTLLLFGDATAGNRYWRLGAYDNSGAGFINGQIAASALTLTGNLTVSGTDYNYVGGNKFFRGFTNYNVLYTGATELSINNQADGANLASFRNNGNFLLGTSTDSGNGRVQLATHTTSAGGIGFGTDTSLYRVSAGNVAVDSISGTNPVVLLREGSVNKGYFATSSGAMFIGTHTANSIQFQTNTTTALTLDSSQNATFAGNLTVSGTGNSTFAGNVGIGVTPNAWSGVKALQITNGVSSIGIYGAGGNEFGAVSNCFYNGSNWIYSTTATATKYAQSGGAHYFSVAGSGTSGNTITFSDAMTLANNGNLLIGTTTDGGQKLQVNGSAAFAGDLLISTNSVINFTVHDAYLRSAGGKSIFLQPAGTTALTLDSSQNATFAGGIIGMTQGNVDNISDDGVASFTPLYNRGFIVINNPDYSQNALIAYFKAGSSYLLYSITKSADVTLNNNTTLTGTTGTDGKLNIGYNNSIIYIENRLGGIANFQRYALGGTN